MYFVLFPIWFCLFSYCYIRIILAVVYITYITNILQISVLSLFIMSFSSVHFAQSCLTVCDPTNFSTPGFLVHHKLPELAQTHIHQVSDAIQPSHPLSSPSPPTFNLSQHQGLFQWVSSLHQVTKLLEFQLQHQSFQWILMINFL